MRRQRGGLEPPQPYASYAPGRFNHNNSADILVELTKVGSKGRKLLLPTQDLPAIIQALYASTGFDYILWCRKMQLLFSFLSLLRFHMWTQSLANSKSPDAYLAFLRLVGTTYFIKYRSTYRGTKSPVTLFNSCTGSSIEDQHIKWLDKIRAHVWEEVQNEFDLPPSHTALKLHWLRTAWVIDMWTQASNTITTLPPTE